MKAVSVLAAIITAVFVFGQIAGAAGYAGEQGMSGIAVHLRDAAGGQVATTETFSHACEGLYIFSGIPPGNYTVEVVRPEGYAFTVADRGAPGATASTVDPVNGTVNITLTRELIGSADLVVRDAGLVAATA